jgi:hypothetical protein
MGKHDNQKDESFYNWEENHIEVQKGTVTSPISGIKQQSHVNKKKQSSNFFLYIRIHGLRINIYRNFDGVPPIPEGPKLPTCNLFTLLTVRIS